jgi:peptide/nickel transport system substrate-binding protein
MKSRFSQKVCLCILVAALVSLLLLVACTSTTSTTTTQAKATTSAAPTQTAKPATSTTASAGLIAAPTATSTSEIQRGGVLKFFVPATPGTPIGWPVEQRGGIPGYTASPALEGLIDRDATGKLTPWLATAWQLGSDKKSIILTLRKGVKFHDGSDLNAAAVKFNLDSYLTAKNVVSNSWSSIDVVDDSTVRINLKYYENTMPSDLTSVRIVSQNAYNTKGLDGIRWAPIGTGPFEFVSFTRDVKVVYKKFTSYWDTGKPYLDGIEMIFVVDPMTQKLGFMAGDANVLSNASGKTAADLQALGFKVIVAGTPGVRSLLFDSANSDSPFSNLKVRQAVMYAINRDAIAKALGRGFWFPMYQIAASDTGAYLPEMETSYSYNPDKAKQLMAEAGFSKGFKTTITPTADPEGLDSMVSVQSFLGAIGITADVQYIEYAKFNSIRYSDSGWRGLLMDMTTPLPGGSFASFIRSYYTDVPAEYISTARPAGFQKLYTDALATSDPAVEQDLIKKLHKLMTDNLMEAPMYGVRFQFPVWHVEGGDILYSGFYTGWHPANIWITK